MAKTIADRRTKVMGMMIQYQSTRMYVKGLSVEPRAEALAPLCRMRSVMLAAISQMMPEVLVFSKNTSGVTTDCRDKPGSGMVVMSNDNPETR